MRQIARFCGAWNSCETRGEERDVSSSLILRYLTLPIQNLLVCLEQVRCYMMVRVWHLHIVEI